MKIIIRLSLLVCVMVTFLVVQVDAQYKTFEKDDLFTKPDYEGTKDIMEPTVEFSFYPRGQFEITYLGREGYRLGPITLITQLPDGTPTITPDGVEILLSSSSSSGAFAIYPDGAFDGTVGTKENPVKIPPDETSVDVIFSSYYELAHELPDQEYPKKDPESNIVMPGLVNINITVLRGPPLDRHIWVRIGWEVSANGTVTEYWSFSDELGRFFENSGAEGEGKLLYS